MMYHSDFERFWNFLAAAFGIIIAVAAIIALMALVEYILQGMALYRMAQNAGFSTPVLAWIPVANAYLLGTLCERAMYRRSGRAWKFSVILPVMEVLALLGSGSLSFLSHLTEEYFYHGYGGFREGSFLPGAGSLLGLAATVLTAIALYNLYWDYAQGREVLFTVLSVVFGGIGRAIILMTLRDRVPVSAQGGGGQQPWMWQEQPFQNTAYTTNPGASPCQGQGPGFYQNQPPYPGQPPYQAGPYPGGQWQQDTPQWGQPYPPYPGAQPPDHTGRDLNDPPPPGGQGPEDNR